MICPHMPDDPDVYRCEFCGFDREAVTRIKETMMDGLSFEWECHEDVPKDTPPNFDTHFTVMGEDDSVAYFVAIKKINL